MAELPVVSKRPRGAPAASHLLAAYPGWTAASVNNARVNARKPSGFLKDQVSLKR
jgi:hypothetical protein